MEYVPYCWISRSNIVKVTSLPKLIYILNNPNQNSTRIFSWTRQLILKFIWKSQYLGEKKIWKAINTEEFPHLEQFCIFYTAGESVELETGNWLQRTWLAAGGPKTWVHWAVKGMLSNPLWQAHMTMSGALGELCLQGREIYSSSLHPFSETHNKF